ncbi:hypothetical protein [Burkholderia anthina]|uniref:hypothetical protein n=1 Tax=Burkholderia anthina TaxID=179879 RepID=UPI001AA06428|nr:hypothetical protein [Burkholderia anthina]QTD93527.1 hypothetical protein J4G50_21985 [Burkholderia anthina]
MNKALLLYVGSRIVRHAALRRLSHALQAQAVPIARSGFATRKTRAFAAERSGKSRFKPARQIGIRAPSRPLHHAGRPRACRMSRLTLHANSQIETPYRERRARPIMRGIVGTHAVRPAPHGARGAQAGRAAAVGTEAAFRLGTRTPMSEELSCRQRCRYFRKPSRSSHARRRC